MAYKVLARRSLKVQTFQLLRCMRFSTSTPTLIAQSWILQKRATGFKYWLDWTAARELPKTIPMLSFYHPNILPHEP